MPTAAAARNTARAAASNALPRRLGDISRRRTRRPPSETGAISHKDRPTQAPAFDTNRPFSRQRGGPPLARKANRHPRCVMKCHAMSCSAARRPSRPASPERRSSPSCMSFLHRVSFRSRRRRLPCGASLFRAYRMCSRVRSRRRGFARLIARASPAQGARLPSVPLGFFRTGARQETERPPDAASSCLILPQICSSQAVSGIISKIRNKVPPPKGDTGTRHEMSCFVTIRCAPVRRHVSRTLSHLLPCEASIWKVFRYIASHGHNSFS